jgi:hypothetical protein
LICISLSQRERKKSQKKKKKAIWFGDPVKMQDCSAKLYYFIPISMTDVEGGKTRPGLAFSENGSSIFAFFF